MKKLLRATYLLLLATPVTHAFDVVTHIAMTSEAIKQSSITATPNTSAVFGKLGLFNFDYAIGTYYVDIGNLSRRNTTPYERRMIIA